MSPTQEMPHGWPSLAWRHTWGKGMVQCAPDTPHQMYHVAANLRWWSVLVQVLHRCAFVLNTSSDALLNNSSMGTRSHPIQSTSPGFVILMHNWHSFICCMLLDTRHCVLQFHRCLLRTCLIWDKVQTICGWITVLGISPGLIPCQWGRFRLTLQSLGCRNATIPMTQKRRLNVSTRWPEGRGRERTSITQR